MRVLAWPGPSYKQQPYITQLYSHLERQGAEVRSFKPLDLYRKPFDVWHMHWPESRFLHPNRLWAGAMTSRLIVEMQVARARGTKLIWTAHNLGQHEGRHRHLEPHFWQVFTRLIDGWIALSPSGKALAERKFPALRRKPCFIVPLGHYREHYRDTLSPAAARERLGLSTSAKVVSFVGQIRAYKNVPQLIRSFRELEQDNLALLVVGQAKDAWLREEMHEAAGGDPRVRLVLEFVPDDDIQVYLRASNLMALPYKNVLNSSSALLALSFNVPVLVPARGSMEDLQRYASRSWVRTFSGELSSHELAEAIDWAAEPRQPLPLTELNWDHLAGLTLRAYEAVCKNVPQYTPRADTPRAPGRGALPNAEPVKVQPRLLHSPRTGQQPSARER